VGTKDAKSVPGADAVTVEIDIAAPPARVFEALTDAKQLFEWWGKEPSVELTTFDMDPRRGGRWQFRCRPIPGVDQGPSGEQLRRNGASEYVAHGEILEYDPPRLLVWSWIANWHEHPEQPTTVRWELQPIVGGTRLVLTHSGLDNEPVERKAYAGGWAGVLKLLNDFLA
jgi:uncharacterized protein YndB with AHSA1/START domain